MSSSTAAAPAAKAPAKRPTAEPTSAPGARKPAAALAGPPPSAMKVSTGGKMIAPAATSAGAGPQAPPTANGVGAGPGHGGIMRPTENGAPGQFQQQQQQQPMMDGMMMMNGYGNGAYGNGTYGPGAMGGYGGVGNDYGGAAAPQPGGGSMYGGMGGYGSMGPGAGGSMYGSMGGANGMGSMYGGGMDGGAGGPMGSMFGGMGGPMGSMYGMGGPMGSMYGMGGPMGSMFGGMGGPMGSMYGMGGPMGSMYGMGGPMGSMYGMGGPMGSMYGGMGSMMGRSASFSSYGGNSIYGSMSGGSLLNIGSTRSIGGMWGTDSGYQVRRRRDNDIPTMAKMLQDDDDETRKRRIVTATAKQVEKDSVAKRSGAAAAPATDAAAAQEDKAKDTAEVSKPKADSDAKTKEEKAKTETKSRAAPGADAGAVLAREASTVTVNKDKGAVADRNGIHGIIILEDPKSTAVAVEAVETWQKVSLKTAAGKPAECKVDEVVRGADADMSKSAVLHVLTTHLRSGHNVALIAVDKKAKMSAAVEQTIVAFYADSLGKLAADQEWKATFSASALSGTNKYRDLQDDAATAAAAAAAAAAPKDIAFGSNPIFGSCIMDLKTATMSDSAAVAKHVKSVLAKATQPQEIVFLQAIVRIRKAKDLFVCSMNAYVVRDSETAEAMAILDDRRVPVAVLRTAIGGATRTAAVTAVSGATASATEEAEAMRILGSLCAKENLPPRSGNVPRFIEYTTEQVVKIEKDMANLSGTEKDRRAHMVEKMRAMANDASELVTNVEAEPRAYPIHSKSSPAPGEKKDATAAAAASVDPKAGSKPADTAVGGKAATTAVTATAAATAPAPSPSAKAPAPTKEAPPAPATEAAATVATATVTTTTAAAAPAGEAAADAAAPPQPFSSIHRLAYLQDIKTPSSNKVVQVVVGGETKAYDVDECIDSPVGAKEHSVEESKELSRMTAVLGAGFNVALLGAELAAPAQPEAQMTWRYVKHLLSAVLRTATPESAAEATLHMSVVHEREVLADLISGDAAPHRLVVATSPLFGPVVHGSASAKATTPEEVEKVMSGALAKAKPFLKDGAMIVMTTVLRKVRKDDVMVASVFAVSAADMRPYKGILDHNSAYSRTLFTYALGGPSSTAVLIAASRDMDAAELANALSAQRSVSHIKVPAPRSGSVKEFVKYATGSLERQKKKVAAAAEPAEQESATNSLRRLTESLRDHEELLANPKTAEVKAYPPDSSTAAASSPAAKKQASPPAAQTAQERAAATEAAPREEPKPRAARQTPATASPLTKTEASPAAEPKPAGDAAAAAAAAAAPPPPPVSEGKTATPQEVKAEGEPAAQTDVKSPKQAAEAEGGQAVQFLAVITEDIRSSLQVKEGWSVVGSDNQLIVTDVDGPQSFPVDEVVQRQSRGSPIDSTLLEELRHRFSQGHNVALLTADTRGSAASLEMVDRTVRRALAKMPPSNALFMSLCALKEGENVVLDTLTDGDDFKPVEVNTSPLFGPSVAGANFVKVTVVEQFSKLMGAGLRRCGESRACVVLQLVQVEVKESEQDVNVSSLLALMCPGDISIYRHALDQPVKERGLLSLALGGSCYTVFAAGLTKQPVDEGCLMLSRVAQAVKGSVRNLKPRDGSMKRFIEHTRGAVAQMQRNLERATSDEDKAKMQGYIDTVTLMVEKSEAYLADPVDKMPPTFPHNRERREL